MSGNQQLRKSSAAKAVQSSPASQKDKRASKKTGQNDGFRYDYDDSSDV